MNHFYLSPNTLILQVSDDRFLYYQALLRKGVLAEANSLTFVSKYISKRTIDKSVSVNALDITQFSLSGCMLDNPSGIKFNIETSLKSINLGDFFNLLKFLDILVSDDDYVKKTDKKLNLFDKDHTGTFHQELGSHMLSLKKNPEMWWVEQKFNKDLLSLRNNQYRYVQEKFMKIFFGEDLGNQNLLDFGCGIGYYSSFFSHRNANVIGVDPSKTYIEIAKEKHSNEDSVEYLIQSFEKHSDFESLEKDKFDIIWLSDVFLYYFVPYKETNLTAANLLTHLKKCLRPGGRIYIMDPHGCFHLQPYFEGRQPFMLLNEYKNRKYRITPSLEEVSKTVENSGLVIRKVRELAYDQNEKIDGLKKPLTSEFPFWWFFELTALEEKNNNNHWEKRLNSHSINKLNDIYLTDILENETHSYNDLFCQAFAIKTDLESVVVSGDCLGVLITNPSLLLPTILACWQMGVIPVILDNNMPSHKLAKIQSIINFTSIVIDREYEGKFNDAQYINVSEIKPSDYFEEFKFKIDEINSPALLLFSSGTTGDPKCIPLSLHNIWSNIENLSLNLDFEKNPTFLCTSPLSYAHGLYNTFLTVLVLGGKILYGGPLSLINAEKILSSAHQNDASVFHLTPSMLPILNMIGQRTELPLPNFKYVICGTSQLDAQSKILFESIYKTPIAQQYGMTEALFMSINSDSQESKVNSVGLPLNCELKIESNSGKAVKNNEIGNIIVKSNSLFGSYYLQPEETKLSYKNGWFYTGDIGYLDEDGYLTISGRKKEIIKKGGFNINPKEIDEIVSKCKGVRESFTIGAPDILYGEDIHTFLLTDDFFDLKELKKYCRINMQKNYVPSNFYLLINFPRTSSGKISLTALKELASN